MPAIAIRHLSKTFEQKGNSVEALRDISLDIEEGDIYGIIGMSGVGKSTLLGMFARNTKADINVIALIGERGRGSGNLLNVTLVRREWHGPLSWSQRQINRH